MPIYSALSIIRHILKVSLQKKTQMKRERGFIDVIVHEIYMYIHDVCL